MTGKRLTKQIVDDLVPRDTDYVVWCAKLPGFGCRVRPSGHKSFVVMYRAGGRNATPRKISIGVYGKLTVEQAREEAGKILAKAELGEDVALQRARARAEMTVSELCDEYMREGVDHKKASTLASDVSRIECHIRPLLGRKRIGVVTLSDISQFLRDVATGKARRNIKTRKHGRSIVRGGRGAASRTVRLLGGIFSYAVRREYLKENPCRGVQLYKDKKGERFLASDEFRRLGEALRLAETEGLPWNLNDGKKAKHRPAKPENLREVFPRHVTDAIRLLMLTGCRLREVLHLRCTLYFNDLKAGLILGKGGRPKKSTTVVTDTGRIERHIIPLLGTRRVKDLTKADINKVLKDIMAGKTRVSVKTKKLRGKAIVRGGAGTATRTVGLLGGILTYAVEAGIIAINPAHGLRKPKDNVRTRRLTEAEYRTLGEMLRAAEKQEKYTTTVEIIRQIALTGCRRSEMIGLMWTEADTDGSCLRLIDSKEGTSIRPIGLPVVEFLEKYRETASGTYVFPGYGDDNAFGSFPNHWEQIFKKSPLADITPHVLRHSFASIGNDLGFTEVTIAALVGHAKGSVTSKYIHTLDTALIMAADTIAGYIQGLLDGKEFKQTAYALDRDSRKAALARFLRKAEAEERLGVEEERLAA